MKLPRPAILKAIETALNRNPVVVLTRPRQCDKTTIARDLLAEDSLNYFHLEDSVSLAASNSTGLNRGARGSYSSTWMLA
jgi:predicted AAA+ superfamily ATPase